MAKNSPQIGSNYEYENDKRISQIETEKQAELKEVDKTYDSMINSSDGFYQNQIDAVKDYGDVQSQLQQEQNNFTIDKIEQQKAQAQKDYQKEKSTAYSDYQKQSNQYGTNAEKMAEMGLAHTGYSESSQVAMYNQYQNRVAMAKESLDKAVLEYNNMMTEARLQNNVALAEIAFNTLNTTLQLSLQGFQYENQLIIEKANKKAETKDRYWNRYQNTLQQIHNENALSEEQRQYNETLALQKQQLAEEKRQFNETMAYNKSKKNGGSSSGSSGNSTSGLDATKVKGVNNEQNLSEERKYVLASIPKGIRQEISMCRTLEGKAASIEKYTGNGIDETQAQALLKYYGISN